MDPLWIVFISITTIFIISGVFECVRSKRKKRNAVVNLGVTNTTNNGTGVVYTIPTTQQLSTTYPPMNTQTPVFIVQDTPPSYDQVVNSCPPPQSSTITNPTVTTTTTMTTIHER